MTYATQQQMIDRFGEADLIRLTDRADPPLDALDATVLQRAQEDAKALIDSYVSARYALPLPSVPLVLVRCECDLAFAQLHGSNIPEAVSKQSSQWLAFLTNVSKGLVSLGPDASNNVPSSEGSVLVSSTPPVFDSSTLADY